MEICHSVVNDQFMLLNWPLRPDDWNTQHLISLLIKQLGNWSFSSCFLVSCWTDRTHHDLCFYSRFMFLNWSHSYLICLCVFACVVSSHFTASTEGLIFSTMCKYYLQGFYHTRTRDKVPLFISNPFWILSVNVTVGEKEHSVMLTGWHTVADIFCVSCGSLVGWKYVQDSKLILVNNFLCDSLMLILFFSLRKSLTTSLRSTRKENSS